jgi:hypothetical protein
MNQLEDWDIQQGMYLSENQFNKEERRKLRDSLFYWLNNIDNPDITLIATDNLMEMEDYLPKIKKYLKYYEDEELLKDLQIIHSLLLNLKDKVPMGNRKLVNECLEDVEKLLSSIGQYPYYSEPYTYYQKHYQYYNYPKSKKERFEETKQKVAEELAIENEKQKELSKWDVVLAGMLKSIHGGEEIFKKKYLEEPESYDQAILKACEEIRNELNGLSQEAQRQSILTQCLEKEGKELENEKEKIKKFRERILDQWLLEESKRWRGEQ